MVVIGWGRTYLNQDLEQVCGQVLVLLRVVVACGNTSVTHTTSAANAVNIFVDALGEVVIHHMLHVLDV